MNCTLAGSYFKNKTENYFKIQQKNLVIEPKRAHIKLSVTVLSY